MIPKLLDELFFFFYFLIGWCHNEKTRSSYFHQVQKTKMARCTPKGTSFNDILSHIYLSILLMVVLKTMIISCLLFIKSSRYICRICLVIINWFLFVYCCLLWALLSHSWLMKMIVPVFTSNLCNQLFLVINLIRK